MPRITATPTPVPVPDEPNTESRVFTPVEIAEILSNQHTHTPPLSADTYYIHDTTVNTATFWPHPPDLPPHPEPSPQSVIIDDVPGGIVEAAWLDDEPDEYIEDEDEDEEYEDEDEDEEYIDDPYEDGPLVANIMPAPTVSARPANFTDVIIPENEREAFEIARRNWVPESFIARIPSQHWNLNKILVDRCKYYDRGTIKLRQRELTNELVGVLSTENNLFSGKSDAELTLIYDILSDAAGTIDGYLSQYNTPQGNKFWQCVISNLYNYCTLISKQLHDTPNNAKFWDDIPFNLFPGVPSFRQSSRFENFTTLSQITISTALSGSWRIARAASLLSTCGFTTSNLSIEGKFFWGTVRKLMIALHNSIFTHAFESNNDVMSPENKLVTILEFCNNKARDLENKLSSFIRNDTRATNSESMIELRTTALLGEVDAVNACLERLRSTSAPVITRMLSSAHSRNNAKRDDVVEQLLAILNDPGLKITELRKSLGKIEHNRKHSNKVELDYFEGALYNVLDFLGKQ